MDKRVYLLMTISFVVGMVELIISGILDLVANDLGVTMGQAGLLITIFSLVFAVSAPILLFLTAAIERKKLTLIALSTFFVGNLIAVFSFSYPMLFISRIVSAASASILIVLCIMMASSIVQPEYRGRAIGIVSMGVSGSLVFGIPFGLILGEAFGWRAPFVLIAILTVLSMIGVYFFMTKIYTSEKPLPLQSQLKMVSSKSVLFALLTTLFVLAGHTTLYAYLNPFVSETMNMNGFWLSVVYLAFGIAAVSGGGAGGALSDHFGPKRTILTVITLFIFAIISLPFATFNIIIFFVVLIIWGMMSWAVSPPIQSFLIETAPKNADILVSLNNSALHFGIAIGSFIGSFVIEKSHVQSNALVGGAIVFIGLIVSFIALKGYKDKQSSITSSS